MFLKPPLIYEFVDECQGDHILALKLLPSSYTVLVVVLEAYIS